MITTALRQKIHSIIDEIPDRSLSVLEPLLEHLANEVEDWEPVIEVASPEEAAMIDERMKDWQKDPSSFVILSSIK